MTRETSLHASGSVGDQPRQAYWQPTILPRRLPKTVNTDPRQANFQQRRAVLPPDEMYGSAQWGRQAPGMASPQGVYFAAKRSELRGIASFNLGLGSAPPCLIKGRQHFLQLKFGSLRICSGLQKPQLHVKRPQLFRFDRGLGCGAH